MGGLTTNAILPSSLSWRTVCAVMIALCGPTLHADDNPSSKREEPRFSWGSQSSKPAAWFGSEEAIRLADNLLTYQTADGGWLKNHGIDPRPKDDPHGEGWGATIDNGATTGEMRFLARAFNASHEERFKAAFLRGVDWLLAAQYPNGGWPQCFPLGHGYGDYITFNDNAMIEVVRLMREIGAGGEFAFVDEPRRAKAADAVVRAVECILHCQIVVEGRPTGWCAQHDPVTFEPRPARSYEKISNSGAEGAEVARFLMALPNPDARVRRAVNAACAWFEAVRITGLRVDRVDGDKIVVADPAAPPTWARFYEIGSNRPIFCGRDGVVKYNIAEIEKERRGGYSWYTDAPARLLAEWPEWKKRRDRD